jgi:hypothetical protein
MKKKLYIGCALNHVPKDKQDFLLMIPEIKEKLKKDFDILEFRSSVHDFINNTHSFSAKEIYEFDIQDSVMNADVMLAICDYPSLGLGYEMATAIEKRGIPVLAMAHKDSLVSRLILGINHPNFQFIRYDSVDEIITKTKEALTNKE